MTKQTEQSSKQSSVPLEDVPPPPAITGEEDTPFPARIAVAQDPSASQGNLSDSDSLDDAITKFKYVTGKQVLWVAMGAMGATVLISIGLSAFNVEAPLVENAFEVFKLIAMTVLGYIFGSKSK